MIIFLFADDVKRSKGEIKGGRRHGAKAKGEAAAEYSKAPSRFMLFLYDFHTFQNLQQQPTTTTTPKANQKIS
jgi:hypothetical protein